MNRIQAIVDALTDDLGRPVGVDDRRFHTLAYSSHRDDVDAVPRESILGRERPAAVTAWLESLEIHRAREPVHIPANDALGIDSRICFPIWFDDRLLGFLWLIEGSALIPPAASELAAQRVVELAAELELERVQGSGEHQEELRVIRSIVARQPVAAYGLAPAARYGAIVVELSAGEGVGAGTEGDAILGEVLERARRAAAPRHLVAGVDGARAVILLAFDDVGDIERGAGAIADDVARESSRVSGFSFGVGVGSPVEAPSNLDVSLEQALLVAGVARCHRGVDSPAIWERLGSLGLIARLLDGRDPEPLLPAPLRRLLGDPDGVALVETVETYLNLGAEPAAEALFLHRSSLYKRLSRVEEIAQVDLGRASDRLEMMIGLQLWRLGGA